ncbi:hypothetical protein [Stutzerimonas stutzeri]|uniref:Uncharacterized protein n=1 Tax=Stutzerimonas stutzeri TaxID=316 RepID=A0AA40RWE3_STUST|nr:hypothetical protein [Stutzerimonas stutzeri]MBA1306645.1 hypothetical protein [Stutzerimonas stutzeri]
MNQSCPSQRTGRPAQQHSLSSAEQGHGEARPASGELPPSMTERSGKWLVTGPKPVEVQQALAAIRRKVAAGKLKNDDDVHATVDLLTEYFVEQGGDLCDLQSVADTIDSGDPAVALPMTPGSTFDPSPLCPEVVAGPVLSHAEKRRVFEQLRGQLARPGHL